MHKFTILLHYNFNCGTSSLYSLLIFMIFKLITLFSKTDDV